MATYTDPYEIKTVKERIFGNPYVGRGIIVGLTKDVRKAVIAYFIMGRSANSRNRIFVKDGENIMIRPFDESKVEDPSLIIYYPVRTVGNTLIVTNGDQTDTIADLCSGSNDLDTCTFVEALRTREFEPDGPNWTPRISAALDLKPSDNFRYDMNILKSADREGNACNRFFFEYEGIPGEGHSLHTYRQMEIRSRPSAENRNGSQSRMISTTSRMRSGPILMKITKFRFMYGIPIYRDRLRGRAADQ